MFKFLIIFLVTILAVAKDPEVVKIGTKVDWPPYHLSTEHGADGESIRALSCIMARINQPFIIEKLPWARAQAQTKDGKLDGFFSASKNSKRDAYATQSEVFLPQYRKIYALKKLIKITKKNFTIDYIKKNFSIGARRESNALFSVREKAFNVTFVPNEGIQLIKALHLNRVQSVVENSLVFPQYVKKLGYKMDEFLSVTLEKKDMGVYFSNKFLKENPAFLEKFNEQVPYCTLIK